MVALVTKSPPPDPLWTATALLGVIAKHAGSVEPLSVDSDWVRPPRSQWLAKTVAAVQANQPVPFVLLGFPAKSPNHLKTLGALPDMAEVLGIQRLADLCHEARTVYPPGIRIVIASDGRVVCDLVRVRDTDVTAYRFGVENLLGKASASDIEVFALDDLFSGPFESARRELVAAFGVPTEEVRAAARTNPDERKYLDGIERFLFEDFRALSPGTATTPIRKQCHQLAYELVARTRAWGRGLADRYPNAVRLSVHPQPADSPKLGFRLVDSADIWRTPWHGVAVDRGIGRFEVMRRDEAERIGCSLVWADGRPSHFIYAG